MNQAIFYFFYNLAHTSPFMEKLVSFLAVQFPYVVIFVALVFILMHHEVFKAESTWDVFVEKKKEILKAFWDGAVAWILAYFLKFIFHVSRPFDALLRIQPLIPESGYGFPSGHATFYMALAFSIYFFHKRAGLVFMFFALVIGIARIASGVHFPSDILGGFVLGAMVAYLVKKIYPHT